MAGIVTLLQKVSLCVLAAQVGSDVCQDPENGGTSGGESDLVLTHVPCTFGHTVEMAGLSLPRSDTSAWLKVWQSFHVATPQEALQMMHTAVPLDTPLWGMMDDFGLFGLFWCSRDDLG
eukprot:g16940.t1